MLVLYQLIVRYQSFHGYWGKDSFYLSVSNREGAIKEAEKIIKNFRGCDGKKSSVFGVVDLIEVCFLKRYSRIECDELRKKSE